MARADRMKKDARMQVVVATALVATAVTIAAAAYMMMGVGR
ncbi:MAG: hypothetical protein OER56_04725 [Hyphomicrobiales bacterium]|nr:hypothetical protein [Hyphomicrobiales bacterium]